MQRESSPAKQLETFIARYSPEVASQARAIFKKLRAQLKGATIFVYDNYQWLVIGFGPGERPSDAIVSMVLAPRWVTLCFLQGARLPDPAKRLRGSGSRVRNVRLLDGVKTLAEPEVAALLASALDRADVPLDPAAKGRLWIKSISAKQRPRRP
jgi:hypothetical protein